MKYVTWETIQTLLESYHVRPNRQFFFPTKCDTVHLVYSFLHQGTPVYACSVISVKADQYPQIKGPYHVSISISVGNRTKASALCNRKWM